MWPKVLTAMFCIGCDYQLAGLSSRCPECGRLFDPNDPSTFAAECRKNRRPRLVPGVISLVFSTLSLIFGLVAFLAILNLDEFIFPLLFLLWVFGVVAVPLCSLTALGLGVAALIVDRKKVRPILAIIAAFVGPVLIVMTWFL